MKMKKQIIVPLDGTASAELAIGAAVKIARASNCTITLLHILEKDARATVHGEKHLREKDEAERYLKHVASDSAFHGITLLSHVHDEGDEDVASSISAHGQELEAWLIVMSRHGGKHLLQLIRGVLPQQIINEGSLPVLLVTQEFVENGMAFERFLVPLDGEKHHESGLRFAAILAKYLGSSVHLLSVVVNPQALAGGKGQLSRFLPGSTWAMQQDTMEHLQGYLQEKATFLQERGVDVTAEIAYGRALQAVERSAREHGCELLVMGTHGKVGGDAFWANSVTAQVVDSTSKAVLMVPVDPVL